MKNYIFGAGYYGMKALRHLGNNQVDGFIDNDAGLHGKKVDGVLISSLEDVLQSNQGGEGGFRILITCQKYWEVEDQLERYGISEYDVWGDWNQIKVDANIFNTEKRILSDKLSSFESSHHSPARLLVSGVNLDDANYGCRATSNALLRILKDRFSVSDLLYRYELLNMFDDVKNPNVSLMDYIVHEKIIKNDAWDTLGERLKHVDVLVINGEGSFIFRKNIRKDLFVFCTLMMVAIEHDVPFYVVNFMLSGEGDEEFYGDYYVEVMNLLSKASGIALRDPISYCSAKQLIKNTKIAFIPDALFSDYYFKPERRENEFIFEHYTDFMPYTPRLYPTLNIRKPYIVVTGGSGSAPFKKKGEKVFRRMIESLKEELCNCNICVVIMECCRGDSIMRNIAVEEDLIFVPVETNLKVVSAILQNALCFVTGRYHPAIIASLGGTPCIFLESNSHKTSSLQLTLEYKKSKTYSAIPSDVEINEIIKDVKAIVNAQLKDYADDFDNGLGFMKMVSSGINSSIREGIVSICERRARESLKLVNFIGGKALTEN